MKHLRPWRLALVMLATVLALTMWLPSAQAAETESVSPVFTRVNPLYGNGAVPAMSEEMEVAEEIPVYPAEDVQSAAQALRDIFKNRETTAILKMPETVFEELCDGWADMGEALYQTLMAHTGKGNEGDYIERTYGGYSCSRRVSTENDVRMVSITFYAAYYTTAEQEAELTAYLKQLYSAWNLDDATDYEKVCAVYDWLCENVTYYWDYENGPYEIYSAYGAVINRECVCQGYAVAAYRMLLDLGVDCRIITGIGNGGGHAWNIIELDGLYYNADATWDAIWHQAGLDYEWYLTCDANFYDHYRDEAFMTAQFYAEYPMSPEDYTPEISEEEACQFQGTSVSLVDGLDMHFFFSGNGAEDATGALVTRYDGYGQVIDTQLIDKSQWEILDGMYYVTYRGIDAKEMGDQVSVTIQDPRGLAISETYTDSIQAYAMRMLEQESNPKLLTLLVDMLNYGAQAQTYFGYMEEALVNAGLTETQRSYASISYEVENILEAGAGRAATALSLKNRITLDLFFDSSVMDNAFSAVVKYTDHNGQVCTQLIWPQEFKEAKGNRICVSVPGLAIADYGQAVTCTVYDAQSNAIAWVTDSIGGYVARMEDHIPEIVSAIAKFGNAAYNYFHD